MRQAHNIRVGSKYINVPQYLIDTKYPIDTLFGSAEEQQRTAGRNLSHKLGYRVQVKGEGYCSIRRLNMFGEVPPSWSGFSNRLPKNVSADVTYSTDETIDFWNNGVRDGWESLYGGECFTVKKEGVSFGFVHSDQIGIYLRLKGMKSRVIPLEHSSHNEEGIKEAITVIHTINGNDFMDTWSSYVGLCLLENKVLPKNPCFSKRKRQIVTI